MTRIACAQIDPTLGAVAANLELSASAAAIAVALGADVVVLPELATAGYMFADPDAARSAALRPADPAFDAWRSAEGERPGEVITAMSTGRLNGIVVAVCDRAGVDRGQPWTEGSVIVDPDGWMVAEAGPGPGLAIADVDLSVTHDKTLTDHVDLLSDRRVDDSRCPALAGGGGNRALLRCRAAGRAGSVRHCLRRPDVHERQPRQIGVGRTGAAASSFRSAEGHERR